MEKIHKYSAWTCSYGTCIFGECCIEDGMIKELGRTLIGTKGIGEIGRIYFIEKLDISLGSWILQFSCLNNHSRLRDRSQQPFGTIRLWKQFPSGLQRVLT